LKHADTRLFPLQAAIALECKVRDFHELKVPHPDGVEGAMRVTGTMVIAEVVLAHANKAVYDEATGTVNIEKLRPMSRLGGNLYSQTCGVFERLRPGKEGTDRAKAMAAARSASAPKYQPHSGRGSARPGSQQANGI
jgi:hypothetical protein